MSWTKKVLRINLTDRTSAEEPLNMEWAELYLGQRGLATKYLTEEVDPTVEPLAPENKLYMVTGPLTGTMASTGGRYSCVTKSPLTNALACSNSGGFFGNEMKCAGWDMIILEGKASSPVYINIANEKCEILPADEIWGKSVWEADEWLHNKHQDPQLRIAAIGVPGENGNLYSAIVNDLHRAAGRSGVGTVMGSKNVKAVTLRGSKGVGNIKDPKRFFAATQKTKEIIANNEMAQGLGALGTNVMMNHMNEVGALPTRNWRDSTFEGAAKLSSEAMMVPRESDGKANLTRPGACFACTIACGRISTIDPEHFTIKNRDDLHKHFKSNSGGNEYEAAWAFGVDTGVDDLDAVTYANFVSNEQAFDPISAGATIAAAMELYELGILTKEDTGGIELNFGNAEAMVKCVELIGKHEGFGKELAQSSLRFCTKYGRPDLAIVVKGQEFPAYDARAVQGMGLGYATSNRGACHVRGYTNGSETAGIPFKTDPLATEGKAELLMAFQDTTSIFDSAGICTFSSFAQGVEEVADQLDAACEGDWTAEKLMLLGERVWNMEREFNNSAGFTAADDTLPPRLLEEPIKEGPAKGHVCELDKMLPNYYEIRGWNTDGTLTDATRKRLSLPL
ncbi:MAG: aldehyde ferredoxin oxidoreductase family protein [Cycloclasticus sp.]|jgi:aldehyde:ferredoxin oxidoreductase|nr:MAG: aldehyde ferredoxin oxidoreductase [Cycloclasticus sp. Phe_18]MEE4291442.1 aldehyde ferredoxin oxidoreductase family protein [Cycloclasticus sp.]